MRRNLEIPKTVLVLKAAPLAMFILLLCGAIARTPVGANAHATAGPVLLAVPQCHVGGTSARHAADGSRTGVPQRNTEETTCLSSPPSH